MEAAWCRHLRAFSYSLLRQ
uniref:Uncharacterized protein n=1 Tax=Anguilla anguilla TaxID=7936 RepID=A0A0E9T7J9_ANGAN